MINHIITVFVDSVVFILAWIVTPIVIALIGAGLYGLYCKLTGKKFEKVEDDPIIVKVDDWEEQKKKFDQEFERISKRIEDTHKKIERDREEFFKLKNNFPQF